MNTSIIFGLAYLAGTFAGLVSGWLLPWWASGATAWVLLIGTFAWAWRSEPLMTFGAPAKREHSMVGAGLFFGALAGAAAVEVGGVTLGHDVEAAIFAVGLALSWLALIAASGDDVPLRPGPGRVGLALWLATIMFAAAPIVLGGLCE